MIVYHSGNVGALAEERFIDSGLRYRLLSYYFVLHGNAADRAALALWMRTSNKGLFLDSGAFSAYAQKKTISVEAYCVYLHEHAGQIATYAALDVIRDWRQTAANLDHMLAQGLAPIPTFQFGSPLHELERLARAHTHLALGGLVSDALGAAELRAWLDRCWRTLRPYWPIRVHGFGVMAQWALERYPFYSVDSTAVIVGGAMGRISQFIRGVLTAEEWVAVAKRTLNGGLVDGVAPLLGTGNGRYAIASAHISRRLHNLLVCTLFERYITRLWAARGISWDIAGAYIGSAA